MSLSFGLGTFGVLAFLFCAFVLLRVDVCMYMCVCVRALCRCRVSDTHLHTQTFAHRQTQTLVHTHVRTYRHILDTYFTFIIKCHCKISKHCISTAKLFFKSSKPVTFPIAFVNADSQAAGPVNCQATCPNLKSTEMRLLFGKDYNASNVFVMCAHIRRVAHKFSDKHHISAVYAKAQVGESVQVISTDQLLPSAPNKQRIIHGLIVNNVYTYAQSPL